MSQTKLQPAQQAAPQWFTDLLAAGYMPYIATSRRLLPSLNIMPFGHQAACFLMEEMEHGPFHEAYLLSNSLSFKSPDLKMPHWVLIDCALMQTAVVGFMVAKGDVSDNLLHHYRADKCIDFDKLTHVPVSGQIASPSSDGNSLTGISLFSLARDIDGPRMLGLLTKALALEVYQTAKYQWYYGIAQYDNPALRIHGRFSSRTEIYQPMVPLHPKKDLTLVYKMRIDFDPYTIDKKPENENPNPTFWMRADDIEAKRRMQDGIKAGKTYVLAPPFSVAREDGIYLPIIEE